MPQCQAIFCTNKTGKCKKSFFQFPNPAKGTRERKLCKKWIENLKNGKLSIETFVAHRGLVVCEDHFTEDCFEGSFSSSVACSLDFKHKRKSLKKDAVPTRIGSKAVNIAETKLVPVCSDVRKSAESISFKRKKAQLKNDCQQSAKKKADHSSLIVDYSGSGTDLPDAYTLPEVLKQENKKNEHGSLQQVEWYTAVPMSETEILEAVVTENVCMEEVECYTAVPLTETEVPEAFISEKVCMEEVASFRQVNGHSINKTLCSCGHPCVYCSSIIGGVTLEHNYSRPYKVSMGTQTEWEDKENKDFSFESTSQTFMTHSTPKKKTPLITLPKLDANYDNKVENELVDLSFINETFRDDGSDFTFKTETDSSVSNSDSWISNESVQDFNNIVKDNKYIVFECMLDQLLLRLRCQYPSCNSPVEPDDLKKRLAEDGLFTCKVFCISGNLILNWRSQPVLGKMPAANLLCSAATLFCGQTYTHISEFAHFMNLKFMAESTFHRIQRMQVMPVVLDAWASMQSGILDEIRKLNKPLRVAGDGRCDSPGYSAKYCTYSVMDLETNVILTYVVIKVSETGSSARMEVEGFKRCMLFLLDRGFKIEIMATDRHTAIRSVMKKEFKDTSHQFDVWHLGKSIKKKLTAKAKVKGNEELGPWIKAVVNHLWWSASQCDGDADWLEESWQSIVHHTVNEHQFPGTKVTECQHGPLDAEVVKRKKWLKRGGRAHNALKEVVLDRFIKKDIRQLTQFCHTGNLEVFHSLMLKYCPKRQEFDDDQMETRTALAVMDHIHSLGRHQRKDSFGKYLFRPAFSKLSGEWTVKPVYESKNYKWVFDLMQKVVEQKERHVLPPTEIKNKTNIAKKPAPPKQELIQCLKSRFRNASKPNNKS